MEMTKGYLRLKGVIWGLNNKEPFTNDYKRSLSFKLNTSKENSLFLNIGGWKNTSLNVKIKGEGMDKPEEVNEQDAIDRIKELFKDGDSVYVNCRADINTYNKRIDYIVNQIYLEKEKIDFNSEDFEEINELVMPIVIIDKPKNGTANAGVVDYRGNMVELKLSLTDEDVNGYFLENVKVGDLLKPTMQIVNKPNYVDGAEEVPVRKTLKGKMISEGSSARRKQDGYISKIEVVDLDVDKTESRKYSREEIRQALEGQPVASKNNQVEIKTKAESTTEVEEELPF